MEAATPDSTFEVRRNDAAGRYELLVDAEVVSFADFTERDGAIVVPHVETVPRHRGHGFSTRLMDGVVDDLRSRSMQIVPHCSFARAHVSALADARDLIAR